MQEYELQTYIDNIQYLNVNEWEQTRLLMYVTAQVNSKKKLDVKNIIKFPWDSIKHDTNISNDDIARLKEQSKLIEEQLRGQLF